MSWVVDLWNARYRGSIVFGGALLIIALIKLTSLLPEAYYFRFSTLLSSDGSPFIVAPPGVTYQRLCAIIRKNRLADPTFSVETSCPAVADENATTIPLYGQQNIDVIYRAVLSNDETMRRTAEAAVASLTITPPTEADVQSTLQTSTNLETASTLISDRYRQAASEPVAIAIIKKLDSAFSSLPIEQAAVPPTAIPTDDIEVDDEPDLTP